MKKETIAFLTRSLVDATGTNMWRGLVDSCKKNKVPVVTFRGPILNKGNGSIIYNLVDDSTFGGVISWASSDVTKDTLEYYKQFSNTPLVCMTFQVPGHPVIYTDCTTGMEQLMDHLIEVHNFTKIAFIRGPVVHVYAKERYEAYLSSLKRHNIAIDEKLISEPSGWGIEHGAQAIDNFINKGLVPGQDFQAVVCVGDNVSIGAQEQLIKNGYLVPHDVAVCGFNGTDDAAWCNPPITTVEMPFHGLGEKAFELLQDAVTGKVIPKETRYSTKMIIAESCGCKSATVSKAIIHHDELTKYLPQQKKSLFKKNKVHENSKHAAELTLKKTEWHIAVAKKIEEYIATTHQVDKKIQEFFSEHSQTLVRLFTRTTISMNVENTEFLTEFSKILNSYLKLSNRFSIWQDFLSILNYESNLVIRYTEFENVAGNIFSQARIVIHEFDSRLQKQKSLWNLRYEADLRAVSADLLATNKISSLMDVLEKSLAKLKIPGVYVILYENCKATPKDMTPPQKSRLILAIRDNERIPLSTDGFLFDTSKILPDQFLPQSSFYSLILESLHFQDTYIGYVLFQEGPKEGGPYTALRDQLSSSLHGALLLSELNKNKDVVEAAMQTMSEKAEIVSEQSKQISGYISTISQSMESVAGNIKAISGNIETVANTLNNATSKVNDANLSISTLADSTTQISNAINMIGDIAETTNVLALNASIEASHAGEAGKGFSVVAKEVKTLAAQTVSTTETIQEMVVKNNKNTIETHKIISSTNSAIKKIAKVSEEIRESINDQVKSSSEISSQLLNASAGIKEISQAIEEISQLGDSLNSKK